MRARIFYITPGEAAWFVSRTTSSGPYRSLRELTLIGLVGPVTRRPPTFVGTRDRIAATAKAASHLFCGEGFVQAEELADAKRALRKAMGKARAELQSAHGADARQRLADAGLEFLGPDVSGAVSGFYPYGSEIDCTGLLERLSGDGWVTALPVVVGPEQPLQFRGWTPGEARPRSSGSPRFGGARIHRLSHRTLSRSRGPRS